MYFKLQYIHLYLRWTLTLHWGKICHKLWFVPVNMSANLCGHSPFSGKCNKDTPYKWVPSHLRLFRKLLKINTVLLHTYICLHDMITKHRAAFIFTSDLNKHTLFATQISRLWWWQDVLKYMFDSNKPS